MRPPGSPQRPDLATKHGRERLASLSDLQWRRRVLQLAITKQRADVDGAGALASASVREDLRAERQDVVNNLAEALIVVADASVREREFRERLMDGGVTFTAHPRPMPHGQDMAVVTSPQSMLAAWFRDAIEHDLIAMEDIPAPRRDRWFGTHAVVGI